MVETGNGNWIFISVYAPSIENAREKKGMGI